ncbi:MAG: DNA-directed RNA polymerase subunit beta [Patescibacteria group bacterium]
MRHYFEEKKDTFPMPDLTSFQKESFTWLRNMGIEEVLEEINPIEDQTGRGWNLYFSAPRFESPEVTPAEALQLGLTYSVPWYLTVTLEEDESEEKRETEIFMGDFPEITPRGTFIVNGVERVVVGQLIRSEGVYFSGEIDQRTGNRLTTGKIIPKNGAWLEFSTSRSDTLRVSVNRSRKMPVTLLLRLFGLETDQQILDAFSEVSEQAERQFVFNTLEDDESTDVDSATLEVFKRLRPGDRVVLSNAKEVIEETFFDSRRFDLGQVGRFKINQVLGLDFSLEDERILQQEDLIEVVREIIRLNSGEGEYTDIDHLANRRVRAVGETAQHYVRVGFLQMSRNIRGRMSVQSRGSLPDPNELISSRPVAARILSFFASSQLSHYHDQNNPLSFLSHLRRLTVKGPGGLTEQRASFSVRDAHYTHYGRICPIETPEGPNIGLTTHLALYSRLNEFGFLETPYRKVVEDDGEMRVSDQVEYLPAWEEEDHFITNASVSVDEDGYIEEERIPLRHEGNFFTGSRELVDYIEVDSQQMLGAPASTIPFLANDDPNRVLMAANMARQAVPLISPDAPIVGTGVEKALAKNSGVVTLAEEAGAVTYVDSRRVRVESEDGAEKVYTLSKFSRSNNGTCLNQVARVDVGDEVERGDLLADGPSTEDGELALGANLVMAYMPWEGLNYEDAFVVSERVVEEDILTSIHIEDYSVSVLETKLGPEEVTRDIPNVSEEALRNLGEGGVVTVGSEVTSGDILVGKIAPKGESELSAEERLLRAIFGEKARDVRDNSLKVPHGDHGTVIDVKVLTDEDSDLEPGVLEEIHVKVAQRRKIMVGDKLAGRHGNKGVIGDILPKEDMPFLEDGTPVDIIINPASVISRMNIGQLLETPLGIAGWALDKKYAVPAFSKVSKEALRDELEEAGFPVSGKVTLYDGRSGEPYSQPVSVGVSYILKLEHMVEEKAHARSTGPYALITQQPLGGKSQFGGQRFGEMEVWALEAYSAAENLHEMLTIKSDDIRGRSRAYRALIQGTEIEGATMPESFKLLVRELNGLGLEIKPEKEGCSNG